MITRKSHLITTNATIQVCEPVAASVSSVFLHLKSGQRMSFKGVFRREVIKQARVHQLAPGRNVDAMAYLRYSPPFGDDRYLIEGKSGLVDLTFLVIRGEVKSM